MPSIDDAVRDAQSERTARQHKSYKAAQKAAEREHEAKRLAHETDTDCLMVTFAPKIDAEVQRIFAAVKDDVVLWRKEADIGPRHGFFWCKPGRAMLPLGIVYTYTEERLPAGTYTLFLRSDGALCVRASQALSYTGREYYPLDEAIKRVWADPKIAMESVLNHLKRYQP